MLLVFVLLLSSVIVAVDQVIKYFIYRDLRPVGRQSVIDGLLELVYSENRGAAFGMFQNATLIFAAVTVVMIVFFIYLLISKKLTGRLFVASMILIIGGGVGNLVDRIFRGFVIDYLALSFFPPICNFADYCITIGATMFIVSILFFNRDNITDKKNLTEGESDE